MSSSSSINIDGTFDISGITPASTSIQALTGAATGSVVLGNKTLNLTNAIGTFSGEISGSGGVTVASGTQLLSGDSSYTGLTTISNGATLRLGAGGTSGSVAGSILADGALVFDRSDELSLSGAISGAGTVEQLGVGTTFLTGANIYTGATTVSGGTLRAGGAATLSAASDYTVSTGGTLDLNSFGHTISSLANGGNVRLSGGANTTLNVTGDYVGSGGTLYVSSVLGADNSPTDLLHVVGSASGTTNVFVTNLGGAGAQTTGDGIKIVEVDGASAAGAFTLNGPAIGGAYRYNLFQNGLSDVTNGNWYLRNSGVLAPTVPTLENYPVALLGMIDLPTLRQRAGQGDANQQGIVTRIEGAAGHYQAAASTSGAAYDSSMFLAQIGLSGRLVDTADGSLTAGLTAQYSRHYASVFSAYGNGSNSTEGFGLGASLTWRGSEGTYIDLQGQIARFTTDLNAAGYSLVQGNGGAGFAAGIEAGQAFTLDESWSVTPQAQLSYASVGFDKFTDRFGSEVSLNNGASLKGRLGLALDYQTEWQDAEGRTAATTLYGVTSLTYEFLDGANVAVSGTDLKFAGQKFGAELGLGGTLDWAGGAHALHGELLGSTSFQGSYAVKGTLGLTVGF